MSLSILSVPEIPASSPVPESGTIVTVSAASPLVARDHPTSHEDSSDGIQRQLLWPLARLLREWMKRSWVSTEGSPRAVSRGRVQPKVRCVE